ncbi:MAG: glycosyltransferase family 4 protein [Candidatus Methanoperedens sp.]|nr:glycosyltransferase family 4 protein [Candidatus Methanoperedens sp.]
MNILFITPWYPNERNPISGIYVKELARAISKNCNVVVLHGYYDASIHACIISDKTEDGIRVVRVQYPKSYVPVLSYLLYLFTIFGLSRKILVDFKPDVIHAHVYLSGIIAIFLGKSYRIPVIVTEHAEIIDRFKGGYLRKLTNSIKLFLAKFVFNNADILVLVSRSLQEYIEKLGVKNNYKIVPNAVNTEIFYPNKINKNKTNKKLLFVGGLTPIKGVPYLLEAVGFIRNKRDDFILDIIGEGIFRKDYEKLAYDIGISDVVLFHGLKDKQGTAEFMRACDFFILPSLYETFGVVLIEALACGKPVISTLNGGQKEFINDENGILISPKDPVALGKAIEYMLDHFQDYNAESISSYTKEKFSYDAVGKTMEDIYSGILSGKIN